MTRLTNGFDGQSVSKTREPRAPESASSSPGSTSRGRVSLGSSSRLPSHQLNKPPLRYSQHGTHSLCVCKGLSAVILMNLNCDHYPGVASDSPFPDIKLGFHTKITRCQSVNQSAWATSEGSFFSQIQGVCPSASVSSVQSANQSLKWLAMHDTLSAL